MPAVLRLAMAPANIPITIFQRATFRKRFRFKDEAGASLVELGDDFVAQFWDEARRTLYADFDVTITDLATGEIELFLPFTITRALVKPGKYDILQIKASGDRIYKVEGAVTIDPGYSDTDA